MQVYYIFYAYRKQAVGDELAALQKDRMLRRLLPRALWDIISSGSKGNQGYQTGGLTLPRILYLSADGEDFI